MFLNIFLLSIILNSSLGLYEDQAGKFDWYLSMLYFSVFTLFILFIIRYQRYVGKINHYFIEKQSVPSRRIVLTSESNVHAALNLYSGNIGNNIDIIFHF